ncbi:MAG: hypothetical protein FJ123_04830 [Deltaproteobacteria bacterium]|nr:hypothetical protein [Deltaproteobacteria bacterium]
MHIDESKKFDKRNIERNIKDDVITLKDYETYLSRLSDAGDKMFLPKEDAVEYEEFEPSSEDEGQSKRKAFKKKANKGK